MEGLGAVEKDITATGHGAAEALAQVQGAQDQAAALPLTPLNPMYGSFGARGMWQLSWMDTVAKIQFALQQQLLQRLRTGHVMLDLVIAAAVFDAHNTLASTRNVALFMHDRCQAVYRVLAMLARGMQTGRFWLTEHRMERIEFMTPAPLYQRNALFRPVQWYLESRVKNDAKSGMQLYCETEVRAGSGRIEIQAAYPKDTSNVVRFSGTDITFRFIKEMVTVYMGNAVPRENPVIVLEADVPAKSTNDLLRGFVDFCVSEYQKYLGSKAWQPMLYKLQRKGGLDTGVLEWVGSPWKNTRKLSTVVLQNNQMDRLQAVIDEFERSRQWYEDRGRPYKLVLLFYGPPGTGKTVTINALCAALKRHKHLLTLGSLRRGELATALAGVDLSKTIVVSEDLDANMSSIVSRRIAALGNRRATRKKGQRRVLQETVGMAVMPTPDSGPPVSVQVSALPPATECRGAGASAGGEGVGDVANAGAGVGMGGDVVAGGGSGPGAGVVPAADIAVAVAVETEGRGNASSVGHGKQRRRRCNKSSVSGGGRRHDSWDDSKSKRRRSKKEKEKATERFNAFQLQEMLAFMEGEDTPGMIYAASTNQPQLLDEAVKRAGRIDHAFLFDKCNEMQLCQLVSSFYDAKITPSSSDLHRLGIQADKFVPADVEKALGMHKTNPDAGFQSLATYDPLTTALETERFEGEIRSDDFLDSDSDDDCSTTDDDSSDDGALSS